MSANDQGPKPSGRAAADEPAAPQNEPAAAEKEPAAPEDEPAALHDGAAAGRPADGRGPTPDGDEDVDATDPSPAQARLREARAAFEAGDYRRVRELAASLDDAPPEVADAAAELRRRTEVDPVQLLILAACLAIFGAIVYVYVL
jgi:hypothetical protein